MHARVVLGPGKVSCLEKCPHFRGALTENEGRYVTCERALILIIESCIYTDLQFAFPCERYVTSLIHQSNIIYKCI